MTERIEVAAELHEDYLLVRDAPIGAKPDGKFVVVQESSTDPREIVAIGPMGEVLLYVEDASSPSGWAVTTVAFPNPEGRAVGKLLAFHDFGQLHVVVHLERGDGTFDMKVRRRTAIDEWEEASLDRNLSPVKMTGLYRDHRGGPCMLFGITTGYEGDAQFFLTSRVSSADRSRDEWFLHGTEAAAGANAFHVLGHPDGGLAVFRSEVGQLTMRRASLDQGALSWTSAPSASLAVDAVKEMHALDHHGGTVLALCSNGDLRQVSVSGVALSGTNFLDGTTAPRQVREASVCHVASADAAHDMACVCALDAVDGRLWVRRLQAGNAGAWAPLGYRLRAFACQHTPADGIDLFGATLDSEVVRVTQAGPDAPWRDLAILAPLAPDDDPMQILAYSAEVRVRTATGAPSPLTAVDLTSDRAATAFVGTVAIRMEPGKAVSVMTDAVGRFRIAFAAKGLSAPRLNVTANFDEGRVQKDVSLDDSVHRKLAGTVEGFSIDGAALKEAGLIAEGTDAQTAQAVADALKQFGTALSDTSASPNAAVRRDAGATQWTFTTKDAKLARVQRSVAQAPTGGRSPGWLESLWGDFLNWLRDRTRDITSFAITVVQGVAELAVSIGDNVRKIVLGGVAKLGELFDWFVQQLSSMAGAVVEGAGKVLTYLSDKFGWNDVLDTHVVIRHAINTMVTALEQVCGTEGQDLVRTKFRGAKSKVIQELDKAKASLAGKTYGQQDTTNAGSKSNDPLSPRGNYILDKLISHSPSATLPPAGGDTGAYDPLGNVVSGLRGSTQGPMDSIAEFLKTVKDFGVQALSALLDVVKGLVEKVLDSVESIALAALEAMRKLLAGLRETINATIKIPVVSWLYTKISGAPLSLIDAFSLVLAVPVTLVYKAVRFVTRSSAPYYFTGLAASIRRGEESAPWSGAGGMVLEVMKTGRVTATPAHVRRAAAMAPEDREKVVAIGVVASVGFTAFTLIDGFLTIASLADVVKAKAPSRTALRVLYGARAFMSLAMQATLFPYLMLIKAPSPPGEVSKALTDYEFLGVFLWAGWLVPAIPDLFLIAAKEGEEAKLLDLFGDGVALVSGVALLVFGAIVLSRLYENPEYKMAPEKKAGTKNATWVNVTSAIALLSVIPRTAATYAPNAVAKGILVGVAVAMTATNIASSVLMMASGSGTSEESPEVAYKSVAAVWKPHDAWKTLIDAQLQKSLSRRVRQRHREDLSEGSTNTESQAE